MSKRIGIILTPPLPLPYMGGECLRAPSATHLRTPSLPHLRAPSAPRLRAPWCRYSLRLQAGHILSEKEEIFSRARNIRAHDRLVLAPLAPQGELSTLSRPRHKVHKYAFLGSRHVRKRGRHVKKWRRFFFRGAAPRGRIGPSWVGGMPLCINIHTK